jgi:hypothetical protein
MEVLRDILRFLAVLDSGRFWLQGAVKSEGQTSRVAAWEQASFPTRNEAGMSRGLKQREKEAGRVYEAWEPC